MLASEEDGCPTEDVTKPKPRGFAAMDSEQHKAIASKGGKAAHRLGVAHRFTSAEASAAGKLGGAKVASVPGHMAELGRQGAKARHKARRATEEE